MKKKYTVKPSSNEHGTTPLPEFIRSLETESEARRTLIELALQDVNSLHPPRPHPRQRIPKSSGGGERGGVSAPSSSPSSSRPSGGEPHNDALNSGRNGNNGIPAIGAGGEARFASEPARGGGGRGNGGSGIFARLGSLSGVRRGVTPEKGASLWAGVGIGAMLQVTV